MLLKGEPYPGTRSKIIFVYKGEYEIDTLLAKQVVSDAIAIQIQETV